MVITKLHCKRMPRFHKVHDIYISLSWFIACREAAANEKDLCTDLSKPLTSGTRANTASSGAANTVVLQKPTRTHL